jgi:hypothetical protein
LKSSLFGRRFGRVPSKIRQAKPDADFHLAPLGRRVRDFIGGSAASKQGDSRAYLILPLDSAPRFSLARERSDECTLPLRPSSRSAWLFPLVRIVSSIVLGVIALLILVLMVTNLMAFWIDDAGPGAKPPW